MRSPVRSTTAEQGKCQNGPPRRERSRRWSCHYDSPPRNRCSWCYPSWWHGRRRRGCMRRLRAWGWMGGPPGIGSKRLTHCEARTAQMRMGGMQRHWRCSQKCQGRRACTVLHPPLRKCRARRGCMRIGCPMSPMLCPQDRACNAGSSPTSHRSLGRKKRRRPLSPVRRRVGEAQEATEAAATETAAAAPEVREAEAEAEAETAAARRAGAAPVPHSRTPGRCALCSLTRRRNLSCRGRKSRTSRRSRQCQPDKRSRRHPLARRVEQGQQALSCGAARQATCQRFSCKDGYGRRRAAREVRLGTSRR